MARRFFSSIIVLLLPVALVVVLSIVATQWASHSNATEKAGPHAPDGVWTNIATFPAAVVSPTPGTNPLRIKRAAAVAYPPTGNIYLLGGRHGVDGEDVALRWIWQYNPGTNAWTQKAALLDGAQQGSIYGSNIAAVVLTNPAGVRIYAVGGSSIDSVETPVTRVYDPVGDAITTDDPWPASPNRVAGGYGVYNNKLYIFGGYSYPVNGGAGGVFTDTWRFDPMAAAGSRWTQISSANLNLGRGFIAGAVVDGKLYAIGGDTWTPGNPGTLVPVTNVEMLDLTQPNPTWVTRADLPTARGDMAAWAYDSGTGYEISGKIAVAGGHYSTPDNQGYLYDPATDSWSTFPALIQATRNFGYAQLNGYLYAFGGYNFANSLPDGANFNQRYDATGGGTNTPTHVSTSTPTNTPSNTATNTVAPPTSTRTNVPVLTSTGTAAPTNTVAAPSSTPVAPSSTPVAPSSTPVAPSSTPLAPSSTPGGPTPTACAIQFTDVPNGSTFYPYIRCLACRGIVSGYQDGTFRPNNDLTRGQLSKIVSNAAGFSEAQPNQMFQDVPVGSTFQVYIGRLASRGYIIGYPCGGPGEPCGPGNLPYFRPNTTATRGQISKIDANAAGYNDPPVGQQFEDVPPGSAFYTYTYELFTRSVMSGYPCGVAPAGPCNPPGNLPYFLPNNNATRGQTAKIVANTFYPSCQTPER